VDTATFLHTHRVFTLDEAVRALEPAGGRKGALERLKYAASRGKLKKLARGVYATVPPGLDAKKFQPDRFLAAAALRPDAIFSHHSALELLGAAHSEWRLCTAYSTRRAQPFKLDAVTIALREVDGFCGMTVSECRGFGQEKLEEKTDGLIDFADKVRLDIALRGRARADGAADAIARIAHTGNRGDGKIFVWSVARVIRIRTREQDNDAL